MNPFLYAEEDDVGGGGGKSGGTSVLAQSQGGGGGNADKPWFSDLPDDLRNNPLVAQNAELSSFVKSAIDTKAMVGANTIRLPGDKATDDERSEFWKKLGRPDDFKGYESKVKPEEGIFDQAVFDQMRTKFHELGLTKVQGEGILDGYLQILNKGLADAQSRQAQTFETAVTALRTDWGQDYDNNVRTAQLAARELGGADFFEYAEKKGLANDPTFIKFLHAVGAKLLDDDAAGSGEGRFTTSQMGAQQEITRLKMDEDFMKILDTAHHPAHKDAVERWAGLHRIAYPGKQED